MVRKNVKIPAKKIPFPVGKRMNTVLCSERVDVLPHGFDGTFAVTGEPLQLARFTDFGSGFGVEGPPGVDELSPESVVPGYIGIGFTQIGAPLLREEGEPFGMIVEPCPGTDIGDSEAVFRRIKELVETLSGVIKVVKDGCRLPVVGNVESQCIRTLRHDEKVVPQEPALVSGKS